MNPSSQSQRHQIASLTTSLITAQNLSEALLHELEIRECRLKIAKATLCGDALKICERKIRVYRPELGTCDDECWVVRRDWRGVSIEEVEVERGSEKTTPTAHESEVEKLKLEMEQLRKANKGLEGENRTLRGENEELRKESEGLRIKMKADEEMNIDLPRTMATPPLKPRQPERKDTRDYPMIKLPCSNFSESTSGIVVLAGEVVSQRT